MRERVKGGVEEEGQQGCRALEATFDLLTLGHRSFLLHSGPLY